MIIASILMLAPLPTVTLEQVLGLDPAEAGELVLRGEDHGAVVMVSRSSTGGLQPPYTVELDLVEQPVAEAQGCSRRRWRAAFRFPAGAPQAQATLARRWAGREIALDCGAREFAHLNPGTPPQQGFAALARLRQVQTGEGRVRFTCTDRTASRLCASDANIRRELAAFDPWAVTSREGVLLLWLGARGQAVTEVRIDPRDPDHLVVERRIPAPA